MKDLPQTIKKRGFVYIQEFKTLSGYVYSQHLNGIKVGYEAFMVKKNDRFNCISFPGDSAFGIWAWSCRTFERAKSHIS